MHIRDEDLLRIVEGIWGTSLHLEVTREERESMPAGLEARVEASVEIVSVEEAWRGRVALSCSANLARNLTRILFQNESEQATPDEIVDALGELANILGGNVKALLPGPSRLSLPRVHAGASTDSALAGNRLALRCQGESFQITLTMDAT